MLPSLKPSLSPLEKLVIPSFVTQSTRSCNVWHLYYFFLALRVFLTSLCVLRWVGRDKFLFYPDIYFPDFLNSAFAEYLNIIMFNQGLFSELNVYPKLKELFFKKIYSSSCLGIVQLGHNYHHPIYIGSA